METESEPPHCKVHGDQPTFIHWEKHYCPRCKKWYDLNDD